MALWGGAWGGPATPSGYASVLIPLFKYYSDLITIGSTNNTLVFRETAGVDLTATLTSGTFAIADLRPIIKAKMEAVGASYYTVEYSHATRKFAITSDGSGGGGVLQIRAGLGGANDAWDDLGYTSNVTGALTYTADAAVPSLTTLTLTKNIRMPQVECEADREDTYLESGRRESTFYGSRERYAFRLEFESVASMQGLKDLWDGCARYGNSFQFYPDSTDTTNYLDVYWDAKVFRPHEMTDRGLYRLYTIDLPLIVKNPAGSSTITARGLIDRRPTQ